MPLTIPNDFTQGAASDANAMNANFGAVATYVNTILSPVAQLGFFPSTMTVAGSASANTAAMQADINQLQALGGGIYVVPLGTCQVNGSVNIGNGSACQIIVMGASRESVILQTAGVDTFQVQTGSVTTNVYGVSFQDFGIKYSNGITAGAAIHLLAVDHCQINGMTIIDAPVAVNAENCLQISIWQCLFKYVNNTSPSGGAMIIAGNDAISKNSAIEFYVGNSTFFSQDPHGMGGGPGGTCILGTQFEHLRLNNLRIEGFERGIELAPSITSNVAVKVYMQDLQIETGTVTTTRGAAIAITPLNGLGIYSVTMINIQAVGQTGGGTNYTGAGIVIDTTGAYQLTTNTGSTIDKIRIVVPQITGYNGPGLSIINNGSNVIQEVQLVGGHYCCNGQTQSGGQSSGIYAIGAITNFEMTGVTSNNTDDQTSGTTQDYGVYFDTGAGGTITGGSLGGNNTAAIGANSPGQIKANGVGGYNTQSSGSNLITTTPPSSTVATSAYSLGYYGPSVVYIPGGSTITSIQQGFATSGIQTIGINFGTIHLAPGENLILNYSGSPPSIVWLGL